MQMTYGDQMKALGRKEAIRSMQELVLSLLADRFGRISKRTRERILAITSLKELSKIGGRIFQVSSIKELGLA